MTLGPKIASRVVGAGSLLMATGGYWHTFYFFSPNRSFRPDFPYFQEAYLTMVAICLLFYTLLLVFGAAFIYLKTWYCFWFLALVIFECVYVGSVMWVWTWDNQQITRSVALATGLSSYGLGFQWITLFWIWAPALIIWADWKEKKTQPPAAGIPEK